MVTGVLSYCLAVYQIFLGLEEDKVGTGIDEEAGVEAEASDVWTITAQEDMTADVSGLGECLTNNATVWPDFVSEREQNKERDNKNSLSIESIKLKGSESVKGSTCSAKRASFGARRGLGMEMEIPGFVLETSENKGLRAKKISLRKKGTVTYLGFNARDSFPKSGGPKEAKKVDDESP